MSIQIKHKASHTQDNILTADEYNEAHDVVGINPGRIPFGVSGNQLGQDDNLFWDNTNKRLGIGTTSPGFRVDVYGPRMRLRTVTTSEDAYFDVEATSTTREAGINFFKGSSRFTANNHSFHIHMKHDNNLRIFSWDGDTAQYVENILYITRGGNVAIRTASAPNILTIQQNSATDPIADAWLQYSTKETKKIIREVNPHGYLEKFKAVKVYEWKRETREDDKKNLPKFRQKHVSAVADDPTTPDEIVARDADGNIQGIDLGAYIGFLHAVIKELIEKLRTAGIEV